MHELSVCQALLGQVETIARQHGAKEVAKIVLHIGPLAGVESRLLQEAFPIARAGTIAEAAEIQIETFPIRVRCTRCGAESEVVANRLLCGACGDWHTQLISGDELLLASMEMMK